MSKTIIIGIDGADDKILNSLNLPTIQSIANFSGSRILNRGMHSLGHAGWITLFTGVWGEDHGGFYRYPLENQYQFSSIIGSDSYKSNPKLIPLWQVANQLGKKVGIMNIPTTYPALDVNGFFISGAGGGQNPSLKYIAKPQEVNESLRRCNYICDVRLSKLEIKDLTFSNYVKLLTAMDNKRKDIFLTLMEEYQPDLGCIVFVGPDRIQHVLMTNLEDIMQGLQSKNPLQYAILEYYNVLDNCIKEICDLYPDSNIVLVSDHGFAPYRRRIDLNSLLEYYGFLSRPSIEERKKRAKQRTLFHQLVPPRIKPVFRKAMPVIRKALKIKFVKKHLATGIDAFDWNKTKAFSFRHCYGIFLNTKERFPCGIIDKEDYHFVLRDIIQLIEGIPGFKAYPCKENFQGSLFSHRLPDIQIDFPDDIFFEDIDHHLLSPKTHFISINPSYKVVEDIVTDRSPSIFNGIHRNESICYIKGPHVEKALSAFTQNELPEFYFFVKQLLQL